MYTNEKAIGKWLGDADEARMISFFDCHRAEFLWNDGGMSYQIFDKKEEAIECLTRNGFYPPVNYQGFVKGKPEMF
jgi:hypothetical protein